MTTAETIYALLSALLGAVLAFAVWTDSLEAEACQQCLEASHGPGACCVVCGRCDQCEPRAGPETDGGSTDDLRPAATTQLNGGPR